VNRTLFPLLLAAVCLIALTGSLAAAVPPLVAYQGQVLTAGGSPVANGTYSFDFAIFDAEIGGSPLWNETQPAVSVSDGLFTVFLGSVTPLPDTVFAEDLRYLQIVFEGEAIQPRTQIGSVPFSDRVGTLDGARGGLIVGGMSILIDSADTAITIIDTETGEPTFIILQDTSGVTSLSFFEPADSKDFNAAPGQKRLEIRKEGITMFGASESDTTLMAGPSGDIEGTGQVTFGQNSSTSGVWSTIFGYFNQVTSDTGTLSGGYSNTVSGVLGTVSGGAFNQADYSATVSGGIVNKATDTGAVIGGGNVNNATGILATIAGGGQNDADGAWSAIGGGAINMASDSQSTVAGGYFNTASGPYATVPGGNSNVAQGRFSFAAGRQANAFHDGAFVWGDSTATSFSSLRPNEFAVRAANGSRFLGNNPNYAGSFVNSDTGDAVDALAAVSRGSLWGALYAQNTGTSPAIVGVNVGGGGPAAYLSGDVTVTGTLSKGGGAFKIDHPLDPENKYLYHSFVESPEMMNVYNGNAVTDADGYAVVTLPEYFEVLNRDFRYQLTVIGEFAQAIVAKKIAGNQFTIRTDRSVLAGDRRSAGSLCAGKSDTQRSAQAGR